jgi:nicotinamide-nucleotide amidase
MTERLEAGADIVALAADLLKACRERSLLVAAAESCTGGLLAATMTSIPGASDVFERGFVTYSNAAKSEMLGVPFWLIERHGAVSEDVARAMAGGALTHSHADLAVGITGIAGPDGGTPEKPVGLVYFAAGRRDGPIESEGVEFGDLGRTEVQRRSVAHALIMLRSLL